MRIHMFSLHGLFRGKNLEIGRDADNGGQIIYVMELAIALSRHPDVEHVHLFTRRIDDPSCSQDYASEVEMVNENFDIRRINCGGKKYLLKEALWPHLDEYVTNTIRYMKSEKILPEWIHSHYADAGYVAAELSAHIHVPFVHSAHSLGAPKLEKLMDAGLPRKESFEKYQFKRRFEAEESVLANSEFVVTSTQKEIELFADYNNSEYAEFHVIPPGIDFTRFYPYYENLIQMSQKNDSEKQALQMATDGMDRFLNDPSKPLILAICRPDKRKNIDGLIHAYGTDLQLQAVANLAIFAGIRGDISNMDEGAREVLTQILLLMDKYNLYGKLAIPKKHDTEWEVPELYRLAARHKGVFVNVALTENFGLTLLEATACGLPVVATNHGGPAEILPKCQNGVLVDPNDWESLQQSLREILVDEQRWQSLSNAGIRNVRNHFSWQSHVEHYVELTKSNLQNSLGAGVKISGKTQAIEKRLTVASSMIISDIDGTLISESGQYSGLEELKQVLADRGDSFVFGVASGRSLALVKDILVEHSIPKPDVVISSVGAYIYYGLDEAVEDKRWQQFISFRWNRETIENTLEGFPGISMQEVESQQPHKLSYYVERDQFDHDALMTLLQPLISRLNIIFSRDSFLDIMPKRSSKGRAVRYLSQKWSIPLKNTIVCGDSGNDLDMFEGSARGIVVANHAKELEELTLRRNNYFAKEESAAGVMEGLRHFKVIQ